MSYLSTLIVKARTILVSPVNKKKVEALFIAIAIASVLVFCLEIFWFFRNLNTTGAEASWGDVTWIHQAYYNFIHNRPLQTSIYYYSGEGCIGNPFAYANQLAMHVNLTPYLFSLFYMIFPSLNGLYSLVFIVNIFGFLLFFYLIIRHYSLNTNMPIRLALAISFLLLGDFFGIINCKALFPLYQGVFVLSVFYAMLKNTKWIFVALSILFLLISDDTALFGFTFSLLLFFYNKDKFYSYSLMTLSITHLFLVTVIIMPVTKFEIKTIHAASSDIVIRIMNFFNGVNSLNSFDIILYLKFIIFIYICIFALRKRLPLKILSISLLMIFLGPASHWFIVFVNGGGHHLMPIYAMVMLALLYLLGTWETEEIEKLKYWQILLVLLVFSNLLRNRYLLSINAYGHSLIPATISEMQIISNKKLINKIHKIPNQSSVTFWTNRSVDGFVVNRNDIWRFPSYFNVTDYLVIQKDAEKSFFTTSSLSGKKDCDLSMYNMNKPTNILLKNAIFCGENHSGFQDARIDTKAVMLIKEELVLVEKSHAIEEEDEHVLVLKRKVHYKIPMPNSSIGFGWVENIPKHFQKILLSLKSKK